MSKVRIFALGGLDEDGKNMYVIENNKDIFVLECGLKYPDGEQFGVSMIIPDFTYLKENEKRIKGIFITHGHEDVMAALPNLLKEIPNVPVYMAPFTALMFERKAKKAGLKDLNIHRIRRNSEFKIGSTQIRTFGTTQSIADGFGVAIKTADGYIVYSSEFIVDGCQSPSRPIFNSPADCTSFKDVSSDLDEHPARVASNAALNTALDTFFMFVPPFIFFLPVLKILLYVPSLDF